MTINCKLCYTELVSSSSGYWIDSNGGMPTMDQRIGLCLGEMVIAMSCPACRSYHVGIIQGTNELFCEMVQLHDVVKLHGSHGFLDRLGAMAIMFYHRMHRADMVRQFEGMIFMGWFFASPFATFACDDLDHEKALHWINKMKTCVVML